jgi:hypothetical protein
MRNFLNKITSTASRWTRLLFSSFSGETLRKMRELRAVMEHWHNEQDMAILRAKEAFECGDMARCEMWVRRHREARLRCEKDFRRPLIQLTGKPNLFDMNTTNKKTKI